jgi:REP element-mobilizing transposase RayT
MSDEGYKIRDQSKPHYVTFTVTEWVDVFTRPVYKDVVINSFKYCQVNKGLILFGYVIMSNHIHLIIQSKTGHLSDLIRDIKRHIAVAVLKLIATEAESRRDWILKRFEFAANGSSRNVDYKFWRDGNHPEEIYSQHFFWCKLNYIHLNPIRQKIVNKASHFIYCSASNYIENKGLVEIEFVSQPHIFVNNKPININYDLW